MNPEKFIQRIRLFNDIINEVINMESNYRTELNVLNLKIVAKIEEYINQMNSKKHRQSIKSSKTISIPEKTTDGKPTLKHSKSKDNFFSYKEEDNPMVDKLISESLQNFLTFYKTKHKLISKEVCDLSNILFEFTSSIKKFDNYNEFTDLEKCKNDFEINYTNFMKSKKKYLEKMNNLEIFFQEEEKSLQIKRLNSVNANNINKNNANNNASNNDNQKEKEKIDQIIDLRQKYKNSLIELTKNQKIYVTKLNELGNDINKLIENYQNNEYNIYNINNNNDNILSLQQDIIDYINNERENSLDNLNNIFNKIIENINQKFDTSKDNKNIKSSLIMIREEFIKKCKEIENKNDESEFQSKEIDNKIKTQTFEQFENINNRIMKEILTDNKEKDTIINYSQKYLIEIKKQMKLEKIKR